MAVPQFHRLAVREVRPETAEAIRVSLEVPASLREAYRFVQGQFLTLREQIDGQELRRSYSVCTTVADYAAGAPLEVAIKRVAGGRFSNWANSHLAAGRQIDVMTPDGRFHSRLDPSATRHHVGFAGGSGITPMMSLIGTVLQTEPGSRFTLVYGNRSTSTVMFVEDLEALKNRHMGRLQLIHVLSDESQEIELLSGLLDEARCARLLQTLVPAADIDVAYICGPAPMMDAAEKALHAAGVGKERILIERFASPDTPAASGSAAGAATAGNRTQGSDAAASSQVIGADVVLVVDGKQRKLRLAADGPSVLDAGLAAGANLPYACKAGVCCTCRARVIEGEVRMDRNFTLEEAEIARGFVLTCQSHPVSDRLVISYDER